MTRNILRSFFGPQDSQNSSLLTLTKDDAWRNSDNSRIYQTALLDRRRSSPSQISYSQLCSVCSQQGDPFPAADGPTTSSACHTITPLLSHRNRLFGPLTLKTWRGRGAKTYKGWICVFVCLTTSVTHLDVVSDYTSEGFISTYRRFTSRRGTPSAPYLIAEPTFWACRRNSSASSLPAYLDISSSPHHWRKTTHSGTLTNHRALHGCDDPEDTTVLTQGHYLIGTALNSVLEHSLLDVSVSSLVLLTDKRLLPGKCPMARVLKLWPGEDGLTRVVSLKTATTTLTRPIAKLAVLPVTQQADF
ncbi:uncharacterized protein LOC122523735 [Polistes fuscatus]|uniref:uncharacterized protein LOC122523735 n=1 Tax=Polistes fuscatus TaxID=30207 RepID=UPI001CAA3E94|nr:uncharacterized protein LOC122523735 [Polistes fuscatus]